MKAGEMVFCKRNLLIDRYSGRTIFQHKGKWVSKPLPNTKKHIFEFIAGQRYRVHYYGKWDKFGNDEKTLLATINFNSQYSVCFYDSTLSKKQLLRRKTFKNDARIAFNLEEIEHKFTDYFYTTKELRTEKLIKINKL